MLSRARRLLLAAPLIAGIVAADQTSKAWAVEHFHRRGLPRVPIVPGRFELDFAFNTGSAFGLFAQVPAARLVFVATTAVALVYMAALLWRLPGEPRTARQAWLATVGLASMAGGAIGNLGDRLLRVLEVRVRISHELPFWLVVDHASAYAEAALRPRSWVEIPRHGVVDFLVLYYRPGSRWPAFNLADVALLLGVAALLVYLALARPRPAARVPVADLATGTPA